MLGQSPSSEPQCKLTLTKPIRLYFHGSARRSGSGGKKLSIPLSYRASNHRAWSIIKKLAGRSTHPTHSHVPDFNKLDRFNNLGRTGHTPNVSPQGSSTRMCLIYGTSQHLRDIASFWPLMPDKFATAFKHLDPGKYLGSALISKSLSSMPDELSNLGNAVSSLAACSNSISWISKRAAVVVIPKQENPLEKPLWFDDW